jgi:hypothetical protein
MTTLHVTNDYNVEASINKHIKDALTAITRPSILPTLPSFVENTPEVTASLPAFSFVHLPAGSIDSFQGRNAETGTKAARNLGILDLSLWVSRVTVNWNAHLRVMQAMVNTVYLDSKSGVIIRDFRTTPSAPTVSAYRVVFNDIDIVIVSPDANVDIERRRILLKYEWMMRSTN